MLSGRGKRPDNLGAASRAQIAGMVVDIHELPAGDLGASGLLNSPLPLPSATRAISMSQIAAPNAPHAPPLRPMPP
jgi:hypothetical protein